MPFAFHFADDDGVHTHSGVEQEPPVGGVGEADGAVLSAFEEPDVLAGGDEGVGVDAEGTGEDVGAAAGDDAELGSFLGGEGGGGAEHAVDGFIDGAVAAVDEDGVVAFFDGAGAEFAGVSAVCGVFHIDGEPRFEGVDERIAPCRCGGGGEGVDDQHDAHENTGYGVAGVEPNSRWPGVGVSVFHAVGEGVAGVRGA